MSDLAQPAMSAPLDSVSNAIATPEKEQPYAALGLKSDEYQRIRDILGRRPPAASSPCTR